MPAPTTWQTPSSVDVVPSNFHTITYAGGYWFSLTRQGGAHRVRLRVTTDPTGSWDEVTLPTQPTGYTEGEIQDEGSGVIYDGTTWAFGLSYYDSSGVETCRIVYTTNPTGTWSTHQYDTSDTYVFRGFAYGDGKWVVTGFDKSGSQPWPGFIGYATSITGTWTLNSSSATTGYDVSALGVTGVLFIQRVLYDGTHWVTTATESAPANVDSWMRVSTSLTSGWAAPSSFTLGDFGGGLRYAGGYWTLSNRNTSLGGVFAYAQDPTGTWTNVTNTKHLHGYLTGHLSFSGTYWVCPGSTSISGWRTPEVSYLRRPSPDGTYTAATTTLTGGAGEYADVIVPTSAYANGYFVVGSNNDGEIRYCYVGTEQNPTYLRRRQSPAYTPSRVRGVDTRARQTPIITRP